MFEIDAPALRLLDEAADFPLDLRRGERQPLVGARRGHAERRRFAAAQIGENRRRQRREVVRPAVRRREVRDAEHAREPRPRLLPRRLVAELDLDASHHRAHRRHVQPRERTLQVAHEQPDEPGPVLPLQRELFVVDDD